MQRRDLNPRPSGHELRSVGSEWRSRSWLVRFPKVAEPRPSEDRTGRVRDVPEPVVGLPLARHVIRSLGL